MISIRQYYSYSSFFIFSWTSCRHNLDLMAILRSRLCHVDGPQFDTTVVVFIFSLMSCRHSREAPEQKHVIQNSWAYGILASMLSKSPKHCRILTNNLEHLKMVCKFCFHPWYSSTLRFVNMVISGHLNFPSGWAEARRGAADRRPRRGPRLRRARQRPRRAGERARGVRVSKIGKSCKIFQNFANF